MPELPNAAPAPDREEQLFCRALELSAPEREALIAAECAGAPLLAARLRALLTAHGASAGFMEQPAASRLPADPEFLPGTEVGRYALLREIGEGAFGIVFHARQFEPIRRDVALKVLKRGMDTRDVIARFEAERQALALLDHPHIARVLDAGATTTGRPFFVMDLVSGARLTHFADEARLTVSARLELFAQVCDAIEHAHQKGVIHRDIKPSNVLVTLRDGAPVPVVIDFGVAKATSALADRTLATSAGVFLGTPGYLSPEQAEGGAAAIDTRTDVYGLGALLRELLVGEPPFGRQTGPDLLRRLRDDEPLRPSLSLRRSPPAERQLLADRRGIAPGALVRALQGDLDCIVQRCLDRERGRRYASVRELAADIRRHLHHEPVQARPPGVVYVAGRLARKHRAMAAVIATAVLLLTGTTFMSLRLAWAASRAERLATAEMRTKEQMLNFLKDDLFAPAAQQAQPVWDLRWRGVLERAAARIDGRFSAQPRLASDMHATLGRSYLTLGDYPAAQRHLELARLYLQAAGALSAVDELALADDLTRALVPQAKLEAAYELWSKLRDAGAPGERSRTARLKVLRQLADIERERRRYDEAERNAREAIALSGDEPTDPLENARSWQTLAAVQRSAAAPGAAVESARRALAIARGAAAVDEAATLPFLGTLAQCLRIADDRSESERLYLELIERRTRLLGGDHPDTLMALSELSFVYQDLGRYEEAVRLAEREVEAKRRVIGPEHPVTLGARTNLAFLLQLAHRHEDAAALHREVLAIRERVFGPAHFANATSHFGIGVALRVSGRPSEAEPWLRRAAELRHTHFGPEHRETLLADAELGAALMELLRPEEAEPLLRRVVQMQREQDPDGGSTAVSAGRWGATLLALGRLAEAEPPLLAAAQRLSRTAPHLLPATRRQLHEVLLTLVRLYTAWEHPAAATRWQGRLRELGLE